MRKLRREGLLLLLVAVLSTGCPSSYTLGFPGPYPTADFKTDYAPGIPISIFYPATDPPLTNLPVVVFNAGWNQPRGSYEGFATQLAQWGYIAVIRSYPNVSLLQIEEDEFLIHVDQIGRILDWLSEEHEDPESPLYGMVDATTAGSTGHSMGAGIAIRAALLDPRVKASVSLDSTYQTRVLEEYKGLFAHNDASMMYIEAEYGGWCARPPFSGDHLIDITDCPAVHVTIAGADHMDFEDSMIGLDYLGQIACPRGPADSQDVRDIATRYMIAWFNVYLKGEKEFESYYAGTLAEKDMAEGLVEIQLKLDEDDGCGEQSSEVRR